MVDIFGNKIISGQYIAYAQRSGNSGALSIGKVVLVSDVVVVIGLDLGNAYREASLNGRTGKLNYGGRIVILSNDSIPEFVKNILDKYKI
jgi:hypothetical protein